MLQNIDGAYKETLIWTATLTVTEGFLLGGVQLPWRKGRSLMEIAMAQLEAVVQAKDATALEEQISTYLRSYIELAAGSPFSCRRAVMELLCCLRRLGPSDQQDLVAAYKNRADAFLFVGLVEAFSALPTPAGHQQYLQGRTSLVKSYEVSSIACPEPNIGSGKMVRGGNVESRFSSMNFSDSPTKLTQERLHSMRWN